MKNLFEIFKTGVFLKHFISINKVSDFFPRRKICISTVFRKLFSVTLVFNLMVVLMPIAVLLQADNAYAADTEHWTQEAYDEIKAKLKEKIKEGLSAEDVKEITDFLKDRVGDELDGTGVGELLGAMNAQAENVTKVQDFAEKLESTIDLVDKVIKAKETGDGKAMMEALGDGVTLAGEFAGKVPVIGMVIGPMLGAYGQAINNGATHIEAIEAAKNRTDEIVKATKTGAGDTKPEGDEEGEEFTWGFNYPYSPESDVYGWMTGNAEANLNREKLKGAKIDDSLEMLENDQADGKTVALYGGQIVPIEIAIDKMEVKQGAADEAINKAQKHYDAMHQMLIDSLEESVKKAEEAEPKAGILGDIYNEIIGIGLAIGGIAQLELPPALEQSLMDIGILQTDENGVAVRANPPDLDSVIFQIDANSGVATNETGRNLDTANIFDTAMVAQLVKVANSANVLLTDQSQERSHYIAQNTDNSVSTVALRSKVESENAGSQLDDIDAGLDSVIDELALYTLSDTGETSQIGMEWVTPRVRRLMSYKDIPFNGGIDLSVAAVFLMLPDPDSVTSNAENILEEAAGGGGGGLRLAEIGEIAHSPGLGHCVSGAHHNPSFHADCQTPGPSGGGDLQ